jgi:hypothetical protein
MCELFTLCRGSQVEPWAPGAYNLSFDDTFTDEEIDRGFEMAKALGADFITAPPLYRF